MSIKEMPVVPAEVAFTRNSPGASKLIMTKKHVMRDAKAEKTSPKIKAFGTALPVNIRFIPPDNQVHKRWLKCEDVPVDIETMEAVWKDITMLRSVRGFVEWLQEHPEVIVLKRRNFWKDVTVLSIRPFLLRLLYLLYRPLRCNA